MPPRTIVAVIISKLLIVPSCNLGLILAALKTGLLPGCAAALLVKLSPTHAFACSVGGSIISPLLSRTDSLLPLCLLIVGASPTAMNMSTIASIAGGGQREVAQILFWQYILSVISMSLFATVGLLIFLE